MNVSYGFRRLDITKKPSFCYRTKVSDWFRPTSETNSSKHGLNSSKADVGSSEGEVEIDEPESALVAEKRASETRMLKNFYQQPTKVRKPGNVGTPSTEDGFEFLDKFKESLKRKKLVIKGTEKNVSKDRSSRDVTPDRERDRSTDVNRERVTNDENSCSDGAIIEERQSNATVDGDVEVTVVSESPNTNSVLNSEPVDCSVCENAEMDPLSDDMPEEIDVAVGQIEGRESCSPEQNSRVNDSLIQTHEANEALETEDLDLDVLLTNDNCAEESKTENNVDLDCHVNVNSRNEKVEKENLNRNPVGKLSSLAMRLKQKTPKRTTPTSSRYSINSFSASKKRKISDYFSPKTQ